MKLNGKTAVVTGAGRGIGEAVALTLAREGADVVVNDVDLEEAQRVAQDIEQLGRKAKAIQTDISQRENVKQLVKDAVLFLGKIDILINNAGIISRGSFVDLSLQEWERVISVNLGGTFNCTQEIVPFMIKQGGGKIVNISSIAAKMGDITSSPAYGSSKGAINTLTKSLARELAEYNINVNAVAPHAIETDMSRQWSEEKRKQVINTIPLRRLGKPRDVAEAALFLVSDAADFITGEILDVNGGCLMD